jgi:hypothetical protein
MHIFRQNHTAVYQSQYVYVLAGHSVCAKSRWEVLSACSLSGFDCSLQITVIMLLEAAEMVGTASSVAVVIQAI